MTALGSPTVPRNLRMALLAKICAAMLALRSAAFGDGRQRPTRRPWQREHGRCPRRKLRGELARERHAPLSRPGVRRRGPLRVARSRHRNEPQVHRFDAGAKFHRRRRQRARRKQCARRECLGQPAPGEDCRQPGDVDRLGGHQRIRQRERRIARQRAVIAQNGSEPVGILDDAGETSAFARALAPDDDRERERECRHLERGRLRLASHRATRRRAHAKGGAPR